jgi:long-chain fatty acid transport protein
MTFTARYKYALAGGACLAAAMASSSTALAGGFAPKEHSALFFGMAYAGSAAGGALSSMFWNPAAVGQFDGVNSDSNYTLIMPDNEITATGGALFGAGNSRSSGDIGDTAILPASYFSYQLSDKAVLGMSVNAPFGLTTDGGFGWDGSQLARESKIVTYNFTPTLAYRVTPGVIVAAGLQVQFMDAQLRQAAGAASGPTAAVKGDDWGFGFTAGILLTPSSTTSIGLGFRSKIEQELEGTFHISGVVPQNRISADVSLPEMVTLSLRQQVAPDWTLLGTVEWTNWSRVPQLVINCTAAGAPACPAANAPLVNGVLPLGWEDGWFVSAGLEHAYNAQLTVRGGVAWEKSPIQTAAGRTIRVPDADRIWASIGASYKYSDWTTIDVSYGHLFVEDSVTAQGPGGALLQGTVESSADAISIGVRSKLDWLFSAAH